jgi:hypothetical protein
MLLAHVLDPLRRSIGGPHANRGKASFQPALGPVSPPAHPPAALCSRPGAIVDSQPELLAHHCTEAGLIDEAAGLWGKAGQRSLARSALVEATAQLSRALDQLGFLPATADLRREQVKLQVALANALMHVKGFAADETNASLDQARLFIERAERLGEPPEDPLVLFSVLYGFWVAKLIAFNGDAVRELGPNSWGSRISKGDRPDHDWAPPHGQVPTGYGGHR